MTDIAMTIPDIHAAYARGVSPEQIIAQVYTRLREVDDPCIFLSMASEADPRAYGRRDRF